MKILEADDHPLVRAGIRHIISQFEEPVEFLEAGSLDEALTLAEQHPDLDLVLLDLSMPGMNGFAGYYRLEDSYPALPIAILSASENPQDVRTAIEAGAAGYIPKSSSPELMLTALRLILAGEVYVPGKLLQQPDMRNDPVPDALTKRQQEVLDWIVEGLSNKLIADRLNITEKTVKQHITTIFRVYGVTNRTQLALKAQAGKHERDRR